MAPFLVTGPATEPITLDDAKLHLRVEVTDEDALIDGLIVAAREYVENFTHRALVTQTWDLKLDGFPCYSLELPKAPTASVTSISYVDTNGTTQTLSSALYTTDLPTGPHACAGRIVLAYQQYYPQTRDVVNAVTVRFVAGYGTADDVPASIKAAMKILIATWYRPGREAVNIGNIVTAVPMTVDALLWPFKSF